MKFSSAFAILVALCLAAGSFVTADDAAKESAKKDPLAGLKCPLSNRPIKKDKVVSYKDSKVYVCCGNCVKGFAKAVKAKPAVAAKSNHQLVQTKQASQVKCCLNGKGKANPKNTVKVAGVAVHTCCKNCLGKLSKMDADKQLEAAFGKTFDKAFVVKAQEEKKKKAEKEAKTAA